MPMPVFVAHYTVDTPYEELIKTLKASLEKHKLPYYIEPIKSLGSWRLNSNYSAKLVQKCLKMFPGQPVLKTDADAIVQRYPSVFDMVDFNPDIAACIWYRFRRRGELLGGTLYFANNEKSNEVVDKWVDLCDRFPDKRNPDLLEQVLWGRQDKAACVWPKQEGLLKMSNNVVFQKLPLQYCKIFDLMANEVSNPVMEHFQASRKNRRTIK